MMRYVMAAWLALMTAVAPVALAQDANETQPEDEGQNAWVEDCPPDRMCAMQEPGAEEPQKDDASAEKPTYGGDCGGEVCAYQGPDEPVSSDNCMDGAQEGEACDGNVHYMDGPQRGPEDGSCESCRGASDAEASPISAPADGAEGDAGVTSVETEDAQPRSVPAPALALGIVVVAGVAVLLVSARRG